jgi:hypothetical protein
MTYSWSYSAFSTALVCLKKFHLLYVDRIGSIKSPEMSFGSALHLGIESLLKGENGQEIFKIYWQSIEGDFEEWGRYSHKEMARMGQVFLDKFEKGHLKHFKVHTMEKRLYSNYKGMKLEGTLDYCGDYKGIATVMDWKTSAYPYEKEKALTSLQLNLYAYLAIKELDYTPKQLGYTPFVKNSGSIQGPLLVDFSEKHMLELLDGMLEYAAMFEKMGSIKNPNSCVIGSRVCEMYSVCWEKEKK